MAVVIKYVVVRNGEEKMTFATKKEADAHDKMLDIADNLYEFLGELDDDALNIDESQREAISLYFAKNSDQVMSILRGVPIKKSSASGKSKPASNTKTDPKESDTSFDSALDSEAAIVSAEKKKGGKSKANKESTILVN